MVGFLQLVLGETKECTSLVDIECPNVGMDFVCLAVQGEREEGRRGKTNLKAGGGKA